MALELRTGVDGDLAEVGIRRVRESIMCVIPGESHASGTPGHKLSGWQEEGLGMADYQFQAAVYAEELRVLLAGPENIEAIDGIFETHLVRRHSFEIIGRGKNVIVLRTLRAGQDRPGCRPQGHVA